MTETRLHGWWSWASVSLLVLLCGVVAVLQYRWIGEISGAERQRLREQLQTKLAAVRRDFSNELSESCAAMVPDTALIEHAGREAAYAIQYPKWKQTHAAMFRRIALAVPRGGALAFYDLDLQSGRLSPADWPAGWDSIRERLAARLTGAASPPALAPTVLELPRFDSSPGNGLQEREWLLFDLDMDYVRRTMIPELLTRYLGDSGKVDFDAEIIAGQAPAQLIYPATSSANGRIGKTADASVTLLDGMDGPGSGRGGPGGPPPDNGFRGAPSPDFRSGNPARGFRGSPPARFMPRPLLSGPAWLLLVRHKAGSLEALVERARVRNLAISAGLLLLIVATVAMLVRFSRQAQRLAELQMSFVAGVSHELRTPLTVIRTAAFNLRGKLAQQPGQVERYGTLIQDESQKLTALVEQVLEFAEAEAGAAMRQREPVPVAELIEQSLQSSRALTEKAGVVLEKQIAPGLPCILADEMAMRHALQNLIDNALKYGAAGSHWVGISARAVADGAAQAVEITVADRGRGIPRDEQKHIFEPFFRGRNAVADQIHGTGLGLDIVRKIVEAHGGSIRVRSTPGQITEFTVRIPAAPAPDATPSAKGA